MRRRSDHHAEASKSNGGRYTQPTFSTQSTESGRRATSGLDPKRTPAPRISREQTGARKGSESIGKTAVSVGQARAYAELLDLRWLSGIGGG